MPIRAHAPCPPETDESFRTTASATRRNPPPNFQKWRRFIVPILFWMTRPILEDKVVGWRRIWAKLTREVPIRSPAAVPRLRMRRSARARQGRLRRSPKSSQISERARRLPQGARGQQRGRARDRGGPTIGTRPPRCSRCSGEHVYIEKPCGTTRAKASCWSRRSASTARRADGDPAALRATLDRDRAGDKEGAIGQPYLARAWYANTRGPIGRGNGACPANLDYELWQARRRAPRTATMSFTTTGTGSGAGERARS